MCIICSEIKNDRMRGYDVRLALVELSSILSPEHIGEVILLLNELEQDEADGETQSL